MTSALTEDMDDVFGAADDEDVMELLQTTTAAPYRTTRASNRRPLVYVTRRIPQRGVDVLLNACDIKQWDSEQAVPRGELLYSVVGVEAILCLPSDNIDADVLDAAGPQLRVVATLSQDTDHIDLDECKRRGIRVITCPDLPTEIRAELTVALIWLTIKESQTDEERLNLSNFISSELTDLNSNSPTSPDDLSLSFSSSPRSHLMRRLSQEQLAFQWNRGKPVNMNCPTWRNIVKKTFGIYGMTKLGLSVAKLLRSVGVADILISDKEAELDSLNANIQHLDCGQFVNFDTLVVRSDVICVCGVDDEQSQEIFSKDTFQKMKKQAILIASQSHEMAIDYVDLYAALRDGQIKAAGLNDCNQDSVPLKTLLQGLQNCVFLPQTEESVYDMRHKVSILTTKSLTEALRKK